MRVQHQPTLKLAKMASPYNPRRISDHDLAALRRSLRRFDCVEPVVVNSRTRRIVGGHQRVKAAEAEGIEKLPVVHVDLDEAQEKQLNLALNRIHGEFDPEALSGVLAELQQLGADLELTGFTDDELTDLLDVVVEPKDGLTDPDAIPEPPDDPATRLGDLVVLGRHRLLCGDSADPEQVARLLEGEKVHLVNTDPPYNVKVEPRSNNAIAAAKAKGRSQKNDQRYVDLNRYPGKSKPTGKMRPRDRELANDFLPPEEFEKLLRAWFQNLSDALHPGRSFYLWGGYANTGNYPKAIQDAGLHFAQAIIWVKEHPVLTRKDFMGNHEWCFYGWKEGAAHYFHPTIHNATDTWSVKKVNPMAMVHLTEKPVELAERALTYSSRKGENVLDLFGGSGSTLIAAERMDRRAYLMELDLAYCDVIVERWQEFTGEKAQGWRGSP